MPPSKDGKEIRLEVVYDSFEEVVDKVVRDLNSLWKGLLPVNQTFNIMAVDDKTKLGMSFFIDDKEMAYNPKEVKEALEVQSTEMNKFYKDIKKPSGFSNSINIEKMKEMMSK